MIKKYAIVFWSRDSRKVKMAVISASSESDVSHKFSEIYRHGRCEILSVTALPEEVGT